MLATTIIGNTITGAGAQAQTPQQGVLATGLVSGSIGTTANGNANAITNNAGAGDRASAGVRLVDLDLVPAAGATTTKLTAVANNIVGNGYGVVNETGAGAERRCRSRRPATGGATSPARRSACPRPSATRSTAPSVTYSGFRTTAATDPATPSATTDARRPARSTRRRRASVVVPGTDLHPARGRG